VTFEVGLGIAGKGLVAYVLIKEGAGGSGILGLIACKASALPARLFARTGTARILRHRIPRPITLPRLFTLPYKFQAPG
jgi:hypothetical protein